MRQFIAAIALVVLSMAPPPALAEALKAPEDGYAISTDLTLLPDPVRAKYEAVTALARAGNVAELGALLAADETLVSFYEPPVGYVTFMRAQSRDGDGLTILAAMLNVLDAPFAAKDDGEGNVVYVWPYFVAMESIRDLTPSQLVDAYRLASTDDLEYMQRLDMWLRWSAQIDTDGRLTVFVASD